MAKRSKQEWVNTLVLITDILADCYGDCSPFEANSRGAEKKLSTISDEFLLSLKIAPVVARAKIEACQRKFFALIGLFDSLSVLEGDDAREQYKLIGVKLSELVSGLNEIIEEHGDEDDVR